MRLSHSLLQWSRWLLSLSLFWAATATAAELTPATERSAVTDFSLSTLKGGQQSLEELRGKVVVINFWATWCGPCKTELPYLSRFHERFEEQGFAVLAVSMDDARTQPGVRRFVRRKRLKMPILLDPQGRVVERLNPRRRAPYTLLIDRSGRLAGTHIGFHVGEEEQIKTQIEALLAEPAPSP